MAFYPSLVTIHIVFAGFWILNLLIDLSLRKRLRTEPEARIKGKFAGLYIAQTNFIAELAAIGILITGIILVLMNPGYGFFDFSANHWLASKQVVMVIILLIVFFYIIPASKKARASLSSDLKENGVNAGTYDHLRKLYSLNMTIHALVILNFLFALSRSFTG